MKSEAIEVVVSPTPGPGPWREEGEIPFSPPPRRLSRTYTVYLRDDLLKDHDPKSFRYRLGIAIESHSAHLIILCLIILDFLIVLGEIFYTLLDEAKTKCKDQNVATHARILHSTTRLLSSTPNHEEPEIMEVLEIISIVIVSVFVVENALKLYAFGKQYYTKHWLHAFDACVVIVTLVLLLIFLQKEGEELIGLLIIFRFWRVIRIIDAVVLTTTSKLEKEIFYLEMELENCRQELATKT